MKYTEELLDTVLKEGGARVKEKYSTYNQRLRVSFYCECGVETTKRFEMLNLHRLPYCEGCSKKHMIEKGKATCMKKYGVSNAGKSEEIKKKISDSFEEKYGMHPLKTDQVKSKRVNTCLEKYGGHPNQNKEVQIKSEATSFAYKEYTMPSGRVVKYQGYEDLALDELVKLYKEEDICSGRSAIPSIVYHIDEKKHVYFPDFFIRSENKIIEVKSEWTIQLRRGNIEEKAQATVKAGYAYEIWVYNDKKVKVETKVYKHASRHEVQAV
jgi:hypothetical protein